MPDSVKSRAEKMIAAAVWLSQHGAKIGWGAQSDGKAVTRRWKNDLVDDPALVPGILHGARNSVIVPTGRLVIIDIDKYGWYEALVEEGLPPTFTVISPTIRRVDTSEPVDDGSTQEVFQGRHLYVAAPDGYDVLTIPGVWQGGETRRSHTGEQSMVLGPWSVRSDGVYEVLADCPRVIAPVEAHVLDYIRAHVHKAGVSQGNSPLIVVTDPNFVWDASLHGSRHDHLRDRIRAWRGIDNDAASIKRRIDTYIADHRIPLTRPGGKDIDDAELIEMIEGALAKFGDDEDVGAGTPQSTSGSSAETESSSNNAGRVFMEVGLLEAPTAAPPLEMRTEAFTSSPVITALMQHWRSRTDAGYEGLLVTTLITAGALMGHGVNTFYGSREQHTNVFGVLVGTTGVSRKGTTGDLVRGVFRQVTQGGDDDLSHSANSGEGLIALAAKKNGEPILIVEEEFARLLSAKRRENGTLSPIFRQAFDDVVLSSSTAQKTVRATTHHVAMIGHVTREEITESFESVDLKNGFANRIAWIGTFQRVGVVVTDHDNALSNSLRDDLRAVIAWVQAIPKPLIGGVTHQIDPVARQMLADASATYVDGVGLAPFLSRRLDTIAARLSLIYACFDRSRLIEPSHVEAALAITDYAKATSAWVFPETTGDEMADLVLRHLKASEDGFLNTREIEAIIGKKPGGMQKIADKLALMGYARLTTKPRKDGKPGRPQQGLELL